MTLLQHNGKPLSIGPIGARETKGDDSAYLSIPLRLQGDWCNSDEGEDMLSTVSGNLAVTIEGRLMDKGSYQPKGDDMMDSPVTLDAGHGENMMIVRVRCTSPDEARMLAEMVKADPAIKRSCQFIEPVILKG